MASNSTGSSTEQESVRRYRLAFWIVGASLGLIAAISVAVIWASDGSKASTQLVFSALLPILGTWVGTVLAFYFARENLKAATDSAVALTRPAKKQTDVSAVMISPTEIVAAEAKDEAKARLLTLAELKQKMEESTPPRGRLPVRSAKGAALYVVHEATLNKYLTAHPPADGVAPASAPTLGDLLDLPEYKALVEALAFVGPAATLVEARAAMAAVDGCNDIFVTTEGRRDEPIIGWLTNTLLAEHD